MGSGEQGKSGKDLNKAGKIVVSGKARYNNPVKAVRGRMNKARARRPVEVTIA
jgi:hypothetical protein